MRRTAAGAGAVVALVLTGAAISAICYLRSPALALALPAGGGFLALACVAPAAAVTVGCVLVVFEGYQVPVAGVGSLSATEIGFLLIAVGWVWRALTGAPGVRYPQIADYPILALILCLPIGLAVGAPTTVVLRLGVMWLAFFVVFLTVKGFTPSQLRMILLGLGLGAGLLGLLGIVGYLSGSGAQLTEAGAGASGRAAAAIADPNYYASYLQLASLPLFALVIAKETRWRGAAMAAVALAAGGVVLSLSRGGLLGLGLGAAVVVAAWARSRVVSAILVAILVVTSAASINPLLSKGTTEIVTERLSSIGVTSENNKRSLLWRETLDEIWQHPAGVGALQFPTVSRRRGLTQRGEPLENVHNLYLNIAVELGVLGLLSYLLWLARVVWDLSVELRRRRPETYAIAVGLAATLAGYSLQALTVSQYRVQSILATFFVLTGAAAAARAWPDPAQSRGSTPESTATTSAGALS